MINKIKRELTDIPKYLINKINNCQACPLHAVRRKNCNPVIGRGTIPADILFIGEAPGLTEELLGKPFIGPSGKLLDLMLSQAIGSHITYYITNIVMCRPTNKKMGDNRAPLPFEITKCSQYLMQIYDIVNPKVVCFVGRVAETNYKREFPESIFIYHPAFLLRGGGPKHPNYSSELRKLSELSKYLRRFNG